MSAPSSPSSPPSSHRAYNLVLAAILLVEVLALQHVAPHFLSAGALANTAKLASELGIVAIGMLLVILVGGIDLSVGSMLALSAVALGLGLQAGLAPPVAAVLAVCVGTGAGMLNGLIVSYAGIPAIIVTLGSMAVFRGVALGLSGGHSYAVPESLQFLGQGEWANVPCQVWLFALLAGFMAWLLKCTSAGVTLFALGHNEVASRFAGLPVARAKTLVYAACGALAGLAAVFFSARVSSAKADFAMGLELDAITIVVLSGASLAGGSANVLGLLLGLSIVGSLRMGLTMMFVPAETQAIMIGLVLVFSVATSRIAGRLRHGL